MQKNREIQDLSTKLHGVYRKIGALVTENPHLSRYFEEKEMKYVKSSNRNSDATNNNSILNITVIKEPS